LKEIQGKQIGKLISPPLIFIGWCCLSFLWRGYVPKEIFWPVTVCTASCMAICTWLILFTRKAVRNRVYLNVKPNVIEIEGAEHFSGKFSSDLRFIISSDAFQKTLVDVVLRESYTRGRFMFPREAAYVRIWPGVTGITDLEVEAINKALAEEFVEFEVEIVKDADAQHAYATAVQA
jgi:hypothetical protein